MPTRGWRAGVALCATLLVPLALHAQTPGPRHLSPESPPGAPSAGAVRTADGLVSGAVLPGGVRTFRGIPFAAPPVGPLRWQPPRAARPWRGVRDGTRFGPQCMQRPIYSDMVFRSDGMSEDCLVLNVRTPAARASRPRPVLLYFYGGGHAAGDGSELRYDGASLARHGVVVVTANYRLGVFGFLAHPELTRESPHHASGDYGLLDQVAALEWVRRNVAAFGGDPRRITIGGESAGSESVSALMASPLSRRLIAGAIGESGAMIYPTFAPVSLDSAERCGVAFADSAGASSLAALRALPAESLLAVTGRPGNGAFPAVVDGWFLPEPPTAVFVSGRGARVPLLAGWNTEESGWRGLLLSSGPTPENYAAAVHRVFGAYGDSILAILPATAVADVEEQGRLLAGATFVSYATWKWAELQAHDGQRVYRYLYAHPRPAPKVPGPSPPPTAAVHSAEIEYALGNLATNDVYPWTADDDSVSATMEAYFANFVKRGNPNGGGLPAWRASTPESARVMTIDVRSHAEPAAHEDLFRLLDRFYTRAPGR